jgi:hypothetical protein
VGQQDLLHHFDVLDNNDYEVQTAALHTFDDDFFEDLAASLFSSSLHSFHDDFFQNHTASVLAHQLHNQQEHHPACLFSYELKQDEHIFQAISTSLQLLIAFDELVIY